MHVTLKTLLNHVEPWKGFVYESSRLDNPGYTHAALTISLRARRGSRSRCRVPPRTEVHASWMRPGLRAAF